MAGDWEWLKMKTIWKVSSHYHCLCEGVLHKWVDMPEGSSDEQKIPLPIHSQEMTFAEALEKWGCMQFSFLITLLALGFFCMCWASFTGTDLGGIFWWHVPISGSWFLLCGGCVCYFSCASFLWQNRTWHAAGVAVHAVTVLDGLTSFAWQKLDIFPQWS